MLYPIFGDRRCSSAVRAVEKQNPAVVAGERRHLVRGQGGGGE